MAPAKKTSPTDTNSNYGKTAQTNSLPWADADILEGTDVTDKANLIEIPFLITGVKFSVNGRDLSMCWAEAEYGDGTKFTFVDSSTGVHAQLSTYVTNKLGKTPDLDVWNDVRLIAPRGLRVSNYQITDERNKTREASTYYLTTSGQRAS